MSVHLTLVSPASQKLELQVHSPESLRDYRMSTKEVNALVNERRRNQAVDLKMRQNPGEDMETLVYTVSKMVEKCRNQVLHLCKKWLKKYASTSRYRRIFCAISG